MNILAPACNISNNGNEHVLLGVFPAHIVKGRCDFHADCSVYYVIGNRLDLQIEFAVPDDMEIHFGFQVATVAIKIPEKELITGNVREFRNGIATVQPLRMLIQNEKAKELRFNRATFKLINFNFTGFFGPRIPGTNSYKLEVGDWSIEMTNSPGVKDRFKELALTNGYGITHEVELYKSDKSEFDISDVDEFMIAFHDALSFANGGWIALHDLKGLDDEGVTISHRWSVNLCESWQSRISWLEKDNVKKFGVFLNSFYEASRNKELFDNIQQAIYWYVRSNRSSSGVDGGMILSISALERLSSFVVDADKEKFKNREKPLSKKIRSVSEELGIAVGIDDDSKLAKLRDSLVPPKGELSDIPLAITRIRNELVHPKRNIDEVIFKEALFPAWNTSQWLIEMIILRLIGYSDSYIDRRILGGFPQIKNVPWLESRANSSDLL